MSVNVSRHARTERYCCFSSLPVTTESFRNGRPADVVLTSASWVRVAGNAHSMPSIMGTAPRALCTCRRRQPRDRHEAESARNTGALRKIEVQFALAHPPFEQQHRCEGERAQ